MCPTKGARSVAMCLDSWYEGALMQDLMDLREVPVYESLRTVNPQGLAIRCSESVVQGLRHLSLLYQFPELVLFS